MWLDIERIEEKGNICQLNKIKNGHSDLPALCQCNKYLDSHLKDPVDVLESLNEFMLSRGIPADPSNTNKNHITLQYLKNLTALQGKIELNENYKKLLSNLKYIYPLYGLRSSLRKLHKGEHITDDELETVIFFIDTFSTVSLHPSIVGPVVAAIAQKVNQHWHTKTCRKYQTICRFNFPKLPSYKTIIARPPTNSLNEQEKKSLEAKYSAITKRVKEVLEDKDVVESILSDFPKELEHTEADAIEGRRQRIDAVLYKAGLKTEADKQMYQEALSYSSAGYTIIMARDIDELFVNSYNPEITRAWDGNTDFQICLDFYAIITYITEYYTKDDTGLVKVLVNTLRASDDQDLKDKMKLLMNTWIKNRQMGQAEAVYRLTKEFHFRESDTKCVFIQTCPRSER